MDDYGNRHSSAANRQSPIANPRIFNSIRISLLCTTSNLLSTAPTFTHFDDPFNINHFLVIKLWIFDCNSNCNFQYRSQNMILNQPCSSDFCGHKVLGNKKYWKEIFCMFFVCLVFIFRLWNKLKKTTLLWQLKIYSFDLQLCNSKVYVAFVKVKSLNFIMVF